VAIKEYDELKRKLQGERKPGGKGGVYYTGECCITYLRGLVSILQEETSLEGVMQQSHTVINGEGWTQEQTAKDLGISQLSVVKAMKIATAIEQYPDLANKKGQAILTEYKRRSTGPIPLPVDKYRTIVIDPPWPMEKILRDVSPNQFDMDYPTSSGAVIENQVHTM
jgi:hypothetical protein